MSEGGNEWSDIMQRKPVRAAFNLICIVACGGYGIGAVRDIIQPSEQSQVLVEQLGTTGYIVMNVGLAAVCLWVVLAFVRQTIKLFQGE
jgi:hypothetical protein